MYFIYILTHVSTKARFYKSTFNHILVVEVTAIYNKKSS